MRFLGPLVLALFGAACGDPGNSRSSTPSTSSHEDDVAVPPGDSLRILALGDSYTIGEGVSPADRWPEQLAALLRDRGVAVDERRTIARTGWTTDELSDAIDETGVDGPYALVTLLIGVNDQFRGRDVEAYRRQFAALLQRSIGFAGGAPGRVLVLSIPDWGATPFGALGDPAAIAQAIDRFNAVNREETTKAGARYVGITEETRRDGMKPGMIASDGLHPSEKMYALWAEAALPQALEAIGQTGARRRSQTGANREPDSQGASRLATSQTLQAR